MRARARMKIEIEITFHAREDLPLSAIAEPDIRVKMKDRIPLPFTRNWRRIP